MKKWLIVIGIVLVIILIIGAIAVALKPAATQPTQTTQTQFPNSQNSGGNNTPVSTSNSSQTLSLFTSGATPITVKNFENSSTTVKDPTGDGYYYVSGGENENTSHAPYQIFYDSQHQYFGITLYKEPLGQYRIQAENELMQDLGISQQQMCDLNYDISAGPGINDLYSSENIGFSFCPGAIELP